jgi:hypothetical protein
MGLHILEFATLLYRRYVDVKGLNDADLSKTALYTLLVAVTVLTCMSASPLVAPASMASTRHTPASS